MTQEIPPLRFTWDGEAMVPKHPALADKHYVVGEGYSLVPHEDRSAVSHRHYFAAVNEAHNNLPEDMAERWPTAEHLRKFALIKAGYRDERSIACGSKAEAVRVAAFIRPIDEFAIVTVEGALVTVFTAKSQSLRSMGRKQFEESKKMVLDTISRLIGISTDDLKKNTSKAA